MKNFFNKFKHASRKEIPVACNNLSIANDCHLVSEIKNYQIKLDTIELEIKALEKLDDNISECEALFKNNYIHYLAEEIRWNCVDHDTMVRCLCAALKDLNLDKLIEELTTLHNKEAMIASKENEANELRNKINEVKNALGIK